MFKCEICMEKFEDNEMSEKWNICVNCYDEEMTRNLIALDII